VERRMMAVEEILNMPSMNEWGEATVRDWIEMDAVDILEDEEYQDLIEDTKVRGYNRDPVHIGSAPDVYADYCSYQGMPDLVRASDKMLGNGHHRIAILYLLGLKQAYYTTDYDESYKRHIEF
jgi:hypothetical protein